MEDLEDTTQIQDKPIIEKIVMKELKKFIGKESYLVVG